MFFSLDNLRFDYRPYPIGIAAPVMDEPSYRKFVTAFPPIERAGLPVLPATTAPARQNVAESITTG